MNTGYIQGKTQTFFLPKGGYISGLRFAGMGPYGGHDPYLTRAAGNPYTGGGAGGGGIGGIMGGNLDPSMVAGSFQAAYNSARDANETRYADILGGYQSREQRVRDRAKGLTQGMREAFEERWKQQEVKALAPVSKNMGPNRSSVQNAILQGLARQKTIDEGNLNRNIFNLELIPEQYSKDIDEFKYSRNDTYPDANRMDRLVSAGGEADGGSSGQNPPSPQPRYFINPQTSPYSRRTGPSLGQLRNIKGQLGRIGAMGAQAATVDAPRMVGNVFGQGVSGLKNLIFGNAPYRQRPLNPAATTPLPAQRMRPVWPLA